MCFQQACTFETKAQRNTLEYTQEALRQVVSVHAHSWYSQYTIFLTNTIQQKCYLKWEQVWYLKVLNSHNAEKNLSVWGYNTLYWLLSKESIILEIYRTDKLWSVDSHK